ncbi:MAG: ornithine cyclodeaminase family protein [Chloroflexota bacterium]
MRVLIVNGTEVRQLLPMGECMEVMTQALMTLARGDAILPLRPVLWLPDKRGALGIMPSYLGDIGAMGLKVVSVFPGNHGTQYDSHQGAVLLFETEYGQLLAMIDATELTAIRTAAVSGVATRLLARQDATNLAILGSGVQARTHLDSMLTARPFQRVRVWSRNPDNAQRFADHASERHGIRVEVSPSAQVAVEGADVICTTTSAREPILMGEWIAPGTHVNAVGSSVAFSRELDTAAMAKARLYVDRRESTINEAGDFLFAKKEGAISDDHILGEIGELLLGKVQGREAGYEITLFKSLGLAVEDLAAANHIYRKALLAGIGTAVELGGGRYDD